MAGARYIGTDGGDSGQRGRTYKSDAAARKVAIGDAVILTGTAAADGRPEVTTIAADTTTKITGFVTAIVPDFATEALTNNGVAASTAANLVVCDDARALFELDSDSTLAVTDVGLNCGLLYVATTNTGGVYTSNLTLKSSTKATTATLPVQIVALTTGSTGTLGERAIVRLNETTMSPGATGV